MLTAKNYLPFKCSHFAPSLKLLMASDKTEQVTYRVWRDKDVHKGTIIRPASTTGEFADMEIPSDFDEITRMELLYVNWDPRKKEWHTNPDYSIRELKEAIHLLEKSIIEFAMQNSINLS